MFAVDYLVGALDVLTDQERNAFADGHHRNLERAATLAAADRELEEEAIARLVRAVEHELENGEA
jgi:hypothetical protein